MDTGSRRSGTFAAARAALLPVLALAALTACERGTGAAGDPPAPSALAVHAAEAAAETAAEVMARGEQVYLQHCAACHQPNGQGLRGAFPPLAGSDYLARERKEVLKVALFGLSGPVTVNGVEYNSVMPSMGYLEDRELAAALTYVLTPWGNDYPGVSVEEVAALRVETGNVDRAAGQPHAGATEAEIRFQGAPSPAGEGARVRAGEGPALTEAEYETATRIYFERCAGCHGVLRKGATGKPLTPDITRARGHEYLEALITYGSPAGMPNWGSSGELSRGEIDIMARFLQQEPPAPPEFGMAEMRESWRLLTPPAERPERPQHARNIDNFFAVTLRDAGEVAIIDGDTREIVSILP